MAGHRDGSTLLGGLPKAAGTPLMRSGYDFIKGWQSGSHHVVRLPAGCIKWVQAGCTMHMPLAACAAS